VACDFNAVKSASAEATPVTYILVAGTPTISPTGGAVNLGSPIQFSTVTSGTTFHYAFGGTVPTCASGTTVVATTGGTGPYVASYTITGAETGGTVNVVACKNNYTTPATPGTATFTYTLAAPTFKFGTGTYDDFLTGGNNEVVTVSPAIASAWLCVGPGSGCGATANTCTGASSVVQSGLTYSAGNCGVNCSGPPPAITATSVTQTEPITQSGQTLAVVACAMGGGAVVSSTAPTQNYTLKVSPIQFVPTYDTDPAGTDIVNLTVSLLPTTTLPNGNPATPTSGITSNNPSNVILCASNTNQTVPAQGSAGCAALQAGLPAGWTCNAGGNVTYTDIGRTTTFSAFACKDNMVYSTASNQVQTVNAYSHTIAMTGSEADFRTGEERINSTQGTSYVYVSWDPTYLYVGQKAPVGGSGQFYFHFYVGSGAGTGTNLDNLQTWDPVGSGLPAGFSPQYHVFWKADGTVIGINQWSSNSTWVTTANVPTIQYNQSTNFVEIRVARSAIGNLTDIRLIGDSPAPTGWGTWPVGANTESVWTQWQAEHLGAGWDPNDPAGICATATVSPLCP